MCTLHVYFSTKRKESKATFTRCRWIKKISVPCDVFFCRASWSWWWYIPCRVLFTTFFLQKHYKPVVKICVSWVIHGNTFKTLASRWSDNLWEESLHTFHVNIHIYIPILLSPPGKKINTVSWSITQHFSRTKARKKYCINFPSFSDRESWHHAYQPSGTLLTF